MRNRRAAATKLAAAHVASFLVAGTYDAAKKAGVRAILVGDSSTGRAAVSTAAGGIVGA